MLRRVRANIRDAGQLALMVLVAVMAYVAAPHLLGCGRR